MIRSRLVRLTAAAIGVAALSAAVSAAPADAAFVLKPRTYTAAMTPASAVPGVATDYAVVVKNTSTVVSALDRFVLAVPAGFTATAGAVTAPRGGWTETVTAGLVTATTATPVRTGLRQGESMTVRFTATDTTTCDTQPATWVQKADGLIIDPFAAQSDNPVVAMTPVADNFSVTDVTDGSTPPLHKAVQVGAPFSVQGEFRCGSAVAPTGSASTLSLTKATAGVPNAGGLLGGTLTTSVPAGSRNATVDGATYSAVENQVGVTADWSGGADGSFKLDVFGQVETVLATPGVAIPPASLTVDGAQADLRNGANGPVSIVVSACPDTVLAPCSAGTQIELNGNFKDAAGQPLYSFTAPARISWLCPASTCSHGEGEPTGNYLYNYDCNGNVCSENGSLFGEREVEEDFQHFPVFVSIHKNGADTAFAPAPRCVPLPTSNYDPNRYALLHTTGVIANPAAQAAGFCADVNAITRTANTFAGDLRIPILFVEDLKLRP